MPVVATAIFADVPAARFAAAVDFWHAVTGDQPGEPSGRHGEFQPLQPADADPWFYLQRTDRPEGAGGWHPDLIVDDLPHAVASAQRLGATVVDPDVAEGVVSLASPGGQPFCLVSGQPVRRAAPKEWNGHRSLADQLCLDIPVAAFPAEAEFWRAMTGWERQPAAKPEFDRLVRPPDQPVRFLLQRRGDGDSFGAHLDLSCDDRPAETRRHEALGASVVRVLDGWTVLRDPVGLPYCITQRAPGS